MTQFYCGLYDSDHCDAQAQAQVEENTASRRKGNLGEIAFAKFCSEELPDKDWTWKNEDSIRSTHQRERNPYDFEVRSLTVDVKTSSRMGEFIPSKLSYRDNGRTSDQTDAIVGVLLDLNEEYATILGWMYYDEAINPSTSFDFTPGSKYHPIPFRNALTLGR